MPPHLKPRTIKEWFELIPFDRARKEALENMQVMSDMELETLSDALMHAFIWSASTRDFDYWGNLYESIQRMEQSIKLK